MRVELAARSRLHHYRPLDPAWSWWEVHVDTGWPALWSDDGYLTVDAARELARELLGPATEVEPDAGSDTWTAELRVPARDRAHLCRLLASHPELEVPARLRPSEEAAA